MSGVLHNEAEANVKDNDDIVSEVIVDFLKKELLNVMQELVKFLLNLKS